MSLSDLPTLNVCLNSITIVFLIVGYIYIRIGNRQNHTRLMTGAVITSICFFISYLCYHFSVGSVPYPYYDWTRNLYFLILIPHIILAMFIGPLVAALLWYVYRENFVKHKQLARWVWPIWIYVSISGILIYFMLYRFNRT